MQISEHVSLIEVTHSNTAVANNIDNTPSEEQIELIVAAAENVFEPLRTLCDAPIKINSVFRSKALNEALNGSKTSQHLCGADKSKNSFGAAFDIDDLYWAKGISNYNNVDLGMMIKDNLDFDQLIFEYPVAGYPKWIHFSYRPDGKNRKQVLIATKRGYLLYEGNEGLIVNPD